jgi:hypothetical protein
MSSHVLPMFLILDNSTLTQVKTRNLNSFIVIKWKERSWPLTTRVTHMGHHHVLDMMSIPMTWEEYYILTKVVDVHIS